MGAVPVSERAGPFVVVHVAVTVDGATTGFEADVGRYYELAGTWHEDATLTGAATVLAQEEALRQVSGSGPARSGPVLAVVDGRARVREWRALREAGYWSEVLALRCQSTPAPRQSLPVRELVVGTDRVDLRAALAVLREEHGVGVVRVDSGGGLTGALLERGLVDEVSLLVHPYWTGRRDHPWYGNTSSPPAQLELLSSQALGHLVWLRYRFLK